MPFSKFIDYLQLEKNYSQHTIKSYKRDLEFFQMFISEHYEQKQLIEIVYPQIRTWIVSLSEQGLTNRTINRKISSLNTYFRFLLKTKQINQNPLAKHKVLKIAKKIQTPFSPVEMENVFDQIENDDSFEGLRDRLIIELFYTTGMRRSELINLKLTDVDLGVKTIKVLGKRNKERIIPLLDNVVESLLLYTKKRKEKAICIDHLFLTNKGLKLYETFVYRLINSYFSKVSTKIKKSPHIVRHTFATHLLNNGADLNSLKELLGHSSLAATQVYTHNSIAQLKKVYTKSHPRNK